MLVEEREREREVLQDFSDEHERENFPTSPRFFCGKEFGVRRKSAPWERETVFAKFGKGQRCHVWSSRGILVLIYMLSWFGLVCLPLVSLVNSDRQVPSCYFLRVTFFFLFGICFCFHRLSQTMQDENICFFVLSKKCCEFLFSFPFFSLYFLLIQVEAFQARPVSTMLWQIQKAVSDVLKIKITNSASRYNTPLSAN